MTTGETPVTRRRPVRAAVFAALAVLVVAGIYLGPELRAWRAFPALAPDEVAAMFMDGARDRAEIEAVDTAGRAVTVTLPQITAVAGGPCLRRYAISDARGQGRQRTGFEAGMAEFVCLADLQAAPHGHLRAVLVTRRYTAPPHRDWRPAASLYFADQVPAVLDRLESRRAPAR